MSDNSYIKVSIIVPIYNAQNYVERCIVSLLRQDIDSYEIICVDDGSKDKSPEIIDRFARQHPDTVRAFHTENKGVWFARKFGIAMAQGKYIGFCDSDDIVQVKMYSTLYDLAESTKAEMAVCAYKRIDDVSGREYSNEMTKFGRKTLDVTDNIGTLSIINTALWNKIILAEIIKNSIDFVIPPRIAEDMMLLASIYPKLSKIAFIDKPLYNYFVRLGSAMKTIGRDDIELTKNAMVETKRYVMEKYDNIRYNTLLDLMAFVHLGVSLLVGLSQDKNSHIGVETMDMRRFLSKFFPTWRNNVYLKYRYIMKHNISLFKLKILQNIYKLGFFPLFIRLYHFIIHKFKIEIKW